MQQPEKRDEQAEAQGFIHKLHNAQIATDAILNNKYGKENGKWELQTLNVYHFKELYRFCERFIEMDKGISSYRRSLLSYLMSWMQDGARKIANLASDVQMYDINRHYLNRVNTNIATVVVALISHYDMTLITHIPPYDLVPFTRKLLHSKKNDPKRDEVLSAYSNLTVWREDSLYYHPELSLCFTKSGREVRYKHMGTGMKLGHYTRELTLLQAKRHLFTIAQRYDVDMFVKLLVRTDTVISPALVYEFTAFVDDVDYLKEEEG